MGTARRACFALALLSLAASRAPGQDLRLSPISLDGSLIPGPLGAADVDGDGRRDLVVGTSRQRVLVLSADGAVRAELKIEGVDSRCMVEALVVRDLDGDGRVDLAAVGGWLMGGFVWVAHQEAPEPGGRLRFAASPAVPVPGGARRHAAAADLDGDGREELIVLGDELWVLPVGRASKLVSAAPGRASGLATGDLDRDGRSEVLLIGEGAQAGEVHVLAATSGSPGTLDAGGVIALGKPPPSSLTVAPLDRATPPALLVDMPGLREVWCITSPGAAEASTRRVSYDLYFGNTGRAGIATGDVDGDGALDVVLPLPDVNALVLLARPGGDAPRAQGFALPAAPEHVVVADVRGDAREEVVVSMPRGSPRLAILGAGEGVTLGRRVTAPGAFGRPAALVDLDGDGTLEVLATRVTPQLDALEVWRQDPAARGRFAPVSVAPLAPRVGTYTIRTPPPGAPAMGELDGDPGLEVVVPHPGGLCLVVLDVGADGVLSPAATLAVDGEPTHAWLVDLDADGRVELLAADRKDVLHVFRRAEGGAFVPAGSVALVTPAAVDVVPPTRFALQVGDLDGDGLVDVVVGGKGHDAASQCVVLLSDPAAKGTLRAPVVVQPSTAIESVSLRDLDADGDLDIVCRTASQQDLGLRNDGAGRFGAYEVIADDAPVLAQTDVDGDGLADTVHLTNGSVVLRRGRAEGPLGLPEHLPAGTDPTQLWLADLDRDGFRDVVVSDRGALVVHRLSR